jgi:hypothetical protein
MSAISPASSIIALAACGDEDRQVGTERPEVELCALHADDAAAIGDLFSPEHAPADLDRVAHRVERMRALGRPQRGLFETATQAEDDAPARQVVHRRVRERRERGMADERVGHQALELEALGRHQACGHVNVEVGVVPPVGDAEAVDARVFVMRCQVDEALRRLSPERCREIERELHADPRAGVARAGRVAGAGRPNGAICSPSCSCRGPR